MYETYFDKLQPHFGREKLHLQYNGTDSFVLSLSTKYDFKNLKIWKPYLNSAIWLKIIKYLVIKTKKWLGDSKLILVKALLKMNLFVWKVECTRLNMEIIVKKNWKVFANLNRKR